MEMGDPIELNLEVFEMHKLNISANRAQRIDEKMGLFV